MRFRQQRFSRTFKNSNATKTNLSENYHSSYVTGCTTNLALLDIAYQDAAAAVSLERYFELFGEEFKCQGAKLRHLRQRHRNARLIICVAILNNFGLEYWYVLSTILLFQLMKYFKCRVLLFQTHKNLLNPVQKTISHPYKSIQISIRRNFCEMWR